MTPNEEKKPRKFWVCLPNGRFYDKYSDSPFDVDGEALIEVQEVLPKPKTKFYASIYESELGKDEYYLGFFKSPINEPEFIRAPHLDFEIEE